LLHCCAGLKCLNIRMVHKAKNPMHQITGKEVGNFLNNSNRVTLRAIHPEDRATLGSDPSAEVDDRADGQGWETGPAFLALTVLSQRLWLLLGVVPKNNLPFDSDYRIGIYSGIGLVRV